MALSQFFCSHIAKKNSDITGDIRRSNIHQISPKLLLKGKGFQDINNTKNKREPLEGQKAQWKTVYQNSNNSRHCRVLLAMRQTANLRLSAIKLSFTYI